MGNYVLWTNKGYLKGDVFHGVEFVDKANARQFTLDEAKLYKDSIYADLTEFFDVKLMKFENA